jgi:hypothetical protein
MKTRNLKPEPQPKRVLSVERSSAVSNVMMAAPIIKRAQENRNVIKGTAEYEKRLKAIIRAHQINCEESRKPDYSTGLLTSEKSREACDAMAGSRKNLEGKPVLPVI